jgi:predicted GNAT family acetyltransferase
VQWRHEPENRRFVAVLDGAEGILEYRSAGDGVLDYFHTYVPPELRGQGIAGELVNVALTYAREHGFNVLPTCPFVARVIDSNPAYADLRAPAPRV